MNKEELVEILKKLLETKDDLDFLLKLELKEPELLVVINYIDFDTGCWYNSRKFSAISWS